MTRINRISVKGYRSIRDKVEIDFPRNNPLILLGENNSGKSNIVKAVEIILGEMWPGSREPEDHDYWNRECTSGKIEIEVEFEGLSYVDSRNGETRVNSFYWHCDPTNLEEKILYRASTDIGPKFIKNDVRNNCICIVLDADRRLNYQLSYTSKYTLLSKLMRRFHNSLVSDEARKENLKSKFADIVEIFHEVEEFANFKRGLSDEFADMLKAMSYSLEIDFSAYDPSNFFHSLRLYPKESSDVRTFDELGTGQEQLLALSFAHAYAKAFFGGIVLIIEEPEAHLHPLAQEWLARTIHKMSKDGLQIILTTHSPSFVNLKGLDGLVLVKKRENATRVKQISAEDLTYFCVQHGASENRTNLDTILPFYHSSATKDITAGLFSKKIILVEGPTEALALPYYFYRVELDVYKEGIAIIPVFGKGNFAKWWRFFNAYEIPTYIIFDNDNKDDQNQDKRKDFLRTLGIAEDDITDIVGTSDWDVRSHYCVFGMDFEATCRNNFNGYPELEERARREIGEAKPLVARYVASKLSVDDLTGWTKMRELKEMVLGVTADQD
jgi:putative ATP-dependent endonuclease of OLD family